MANTTLVIILEKIASKDKDFRYMATSDLLHELQKDTFKADAELEKKLCAVVLNQLEDPSGDISNLAVSCLGYLARKVAEVRAEDMVRQLCDKVAGAGPASGGSSAASKARDAQREIASIGLKALIKELAGGAAAGVGANSQLVSSASTIIAGRMLEGLNIHKDDSEVVGHVLDILTELIQRFGGLLVSEHCRIRDALLGALGEGRLVMRKKALQGLAALSVFLNDDALESVVTYLLTALQAPNAKADFVRTYIQAVGQISRAVGYRFGRYLATAVPLAISHCNKATEGDDELREHCLQALEGFVLRCPHDTRSQLDAVQAAALRYLRYDPNFAPDDEEGGDEDMGDDDEEADDDGDGDDADEYSDDEDMSWKVRRAATRIVSALVSRYPDALPALYRASMSDLVSRFDKEREEGVKADVFAAVSEMLAQVGATADRYAPGDANSPTALLTGDVASIVRASAKQLRDKSPKTRVGVFGVLRQLVAVQASSMSGQVDALVPGLLAALNDKSGNTGLKIEALSFLRQTIAATPPSVFQPHTKQLAPAVFGCVNERYYKVAAEALRVCEALVGVLRPDPAGPVPPEQASLVAPLYSAIMTRLSATDQDQEVKECAISAMAATAARLGDCLQKELPSVLRVLLDRLRNEITRLTAVKALTTLASSPLVSGELLAGTVEGGSGVASELTSFLRKANRLLRQASLVALEALATRYPAAFEGPVLTAAVEEAAALVSDADVALASLALRFLVSLTAMPGPAGAAAAAVVVDKVRGPALALVRSPLLQGAALEVLQSFFAALATAAGPQGGADALLAALLDAGRSAEASSKQAQHSVARCVAALATTSPAKVPAVVEMLLKSVGAKDSGSQRLALLCLGEIGGRADLSGLPAVAAAATGVLSAPGSSEEVRAAASHALGGITRGNLHHFMPDLVAQIAAAAGLPKQQYLLLQVREDSLIRHGAGYGLGLFRASVLSLLFNAAESEEECRNVVAECAGRLALLHPAKVLPALLERTTAASGNIRAVVVSAVKHAVVDRPHPVDAELGPVLLRFLLLMGDEDRHVRRSAVVALSGCAHAKPGLVVGDLAQLLPLLYAQTAVREDMIRTVDLGPFKHKIDDGLELRKAAFECLDILNDCCRDRLEPVPFLAALESGLGDHADVKMPCHTTLSKLVATDPGAVLAAADRLVVPLEKTLTTRLKSDAVKQEIDRHEDMLRSCLRCVDALEHVPGSDNNVAFQNFLRKVVLATPALKEKYVAIQRERAEAEGGDAMDTA
ncbi:hypothetical protein VOLCADRAFT_79240 [Volvox carteri f. nagariensis]|uniref:TATA-binding protein interacting (TIP20) domain-containing protein n=1 Tax=Volvox carteri f. nagariensis TaxID=3068 RepID=D8TKM3_VOLCA|nr:uncharacterized protein VOLCADRAFT_79240 [Volvox carteri f. nagariensis]EFJ52089.1 hypothetical protein VOLCADRAFT_79240 [Volvox carteri f. nagariensis]|eukprot:XP_002946863.1 hypothetical protein VOLCADRAFT_79240 [Volvox carteri f. nagariensis]